MQSLASQARDTAHDILRYQRQALDTILAPQSVAVIGATERVGGAGRTVVWNIVSNKFPNGLKHRR